MEYINLERTRLARPDQIAVLISTVLVCCILVASVVDKCKFHETCKLEEVAKKEKVEILWVPAHTTHLLQPWDCQVFLTYKRFCRMLYKGLRRKEDLQGFGKTVVPLRAVMKAGIEALRMLTSYFLKQGWEISYLEPFNMST